MEKEFDSCILCPRKCKVNRNKGQLGYCKAGIKMTIGGYRLHLWEEPIITGKKGSGTIFFSHCNMKCIYCQNYNISTKNEGEEITIERFTEICLFLQKEGASNINLVTPTHYIPLIRKGLILAKNKGLNIPIVYNTSAYENIPALKSLEGLIDIYLPDLKYYDNNLNKYSHVKNYFLYSKLAIEEMYHQVGRTQYSKDGTIKKGVIVRHLVLPGHTDDSKKIIKYLHDKYDDNIIISLMNQYTPVRKVEYSNLNRKVSKFEYDDLVNYTYNLGIRKCFIQDEESQDTSFIPSFKGDHMI